MKAKYICLRNGDINPLIQVSVEINGKTRIRFYDPTVHTLSAHDKRRMQHELDEWYQDDQHQIDMANYAEQLFLRADHGRIY